MLSFRPRMLTDTLTEARKHKLRADRHFHSSSGESCCTCLAWQVTNEKPQVYLGRGLEQRRREEEGGEGKRGIEGEGKEGQEGMLEYEEEG